MHSTDHNINNPTAVDLITLHRSLESWQYPTIRNISQEQYDLMATHDPLVYYIITDSIKGPMSKPRIYLGDHLLPPERDDVKYVLGIDEHEEYTIYMNIHYGDYDHLTPVRRYPSAQQAVNDLRFYNHVGSHTDAAISTYRILISYINRDISINDALIGIISAYGFRDTAEIQEVIQTGITHGCSHTDIDLPVYYRDLLPVLRETTKNFLVKKYANLYDLMVKWDFFKDEKYKDAVSGIDLSKQVQDIQYLMIECPKM